MELAFSAAAERNRLPILQVLQRVLPARGRVLEIASGTGQHVACFASNLPLLDWLPTEPRVEMHDVIRARVVDAGLDNVDEPFALDVLGSWPQIKVDAVIVANLLHISAAATLPALSQGAAKICRPGAVLHLYGPFKQGGQHTSETNAQFDESLRCRNADWGIRNLETVIEVASSSGFNLLEKIEMPANNFSLVFSLAS